ncbi:MULTISPECIES: hypothetical protein [Arcobacteraceae]|jgi:enoyl reductase-like protein|uniref:Uncharacterized protein n=1 Tax=Aliarcobacter skirrowii TaxID=28200 RepID=A0AAW9DCF8_9BACT|nr:MULTISPECIES: hypothetical protein [Arcobacteraceae]MDX4069847.1 hypothetical protein [Aliarcobacter skirrowii]RXK03602.1 hypothetical protein CRU97_12245 [Halarcobacter bivalviorum]RYA22173.1 hypothetical protein CRU96_14515 [Malaciobacter halophilus]
MHELKDVQEYLSKILSKERVEECYNLISNPQNRVNSPDKKWVAYETQASENQTVVNAIQEILVNNLPSWSIPLLNDIKKAVDEVGILFENSNIEMKPRIPFYVLVLNKLI